MVLIPPRLALFLSGDISMEWLFFGLCQETTKTVTGEIQSWASILTSGGFGAVVWYLIAKTLPMMQERFDENSKQQVDLFRESLDKIQEYHTARTERELKRIADVYEASISRMMQSLK